MSVPTQLIHQVFEQQVKAQPNAPAVTCVGHTLSYAQLNERANQLAHVLLSMGVQPDQRVGLCVERNLGLVVGVLAILKAGAAYVPLDPNYPSERLVHAMSDSGVRVLICQERCSPALACDHASVINIDAAGQALFAHNAAITNPNPPDLRDHHAAYVIYTSGSTGRPKGVVVEHRHVMALLHATQPLFAFGPKDVWTLFHSIAFDFSVWELWGALLYGGRLIVVCVTIARSPEAFYALLLSERVTVLNQTPSAFRPLIAAQARQGGEHHLRTIILGGEALVLQSLVPWFERNNAEKTKLVNMYGITEITVHATYAVITPQQCEQGLGSMVGKALPHLQLHLLNEQGQAVASGDAGEIHVGGASVARGYLNRPELSATRFLPDPFTQGPNARMYKTGDLARQHPDGQLEYLGRNDFQVKIRGHRVELGEIESILLRHDAVQEAVVFAWDEPGSGEKNLTAYCVGAELPDGALRGFCQQHLPAHMVPAHFVWLEKIPLTPNGKIDRQWLPSSHCNHPLVTTPASSLEARICALWGQLLHAPKVQPVDDFFALGGNSLSAVRMTLRVRDMLKGLPVDIAVVFQNPVARDFAQAVHQLQS